MGGEHLSEALFAQRHRFGLWVPVWLGLGVALYFSLRFEPDVWLLASVCGLVLLAAPLSRIGPDPLRVLIWVPALVSLGFLVTAGRAHWVAAPKLGWHYYGSVEGTIVHLDRSGSDKPRVTLADPVLERMDPARVPDRVRVSLHSELNGTALKPGARIMLTASLSPPAGPVEPKGFDFQRMAWFNRLGAVGYARAPPVLAVPADNRAFALRVFALRMQMSRHIQHHIPGRTGAFAAAILTGDRSQIDPLLLADLRRSNLAHLLAISGLHMGLLTGFVFALIRLGIAAVPYLSVRLQAKKIGAVVALLAGAGYLLVSGANIATQRAFVMVAVMLVAVLLERPAITLRAVAIAATLILLFRPESLSGPGFQMSFAATTALVATFESLNRARGWQALRQSRFSLVSPFASLFIASAVAGAATAPFSAFHFNQMAQYGLLANLASVPVMSLVVMPAAVIAGVLTLVGLEGGAFWVMGQGIDWILAVAHFVAAQDGSVVRIKSGPVWALGLVTLGGLIVIIWQGRSRFLGVLVACLGFGCWTWATRPDLLITQNGRMAGILTEQGRAISRSRGNGFAAQNWLENDADAADQAIAAARFVEDGDDWRVEFDGGTVAYLWGKKRSAEEIRAACDTSDLLIVPQWKAQITGPCQPVTAADLRKSGSVAVRSNRKGLTVQTARQASGTRLWNER
ncbi:ComEC/Rec2 family competence protein [Neptunicoccus sediminis]|uniref:ComEC/Rec2 family competence protein n=1 Tax=Neptunicoccus sediminis TaxID=1892596 RepID=UPI000845D475|nr:ComEC/Rec2 family competence protein [Neptunicoccus sediminis]